MRAATSVFRVQQILLARFDEALRPHDLTFARYEVLVLLTFSRTGELPLKVIGSRLMVHPTSVTNAIDRLGGGRLRGAAAEPGRRPGCAGADHRRRPGRRRAGHDGAHRPWTSGSPTCPPASWPRCSTSSAGSGSAPATSRTNPAPEPSTEDSWTSYYPGMGDDARQRWQQRYDAALAAGKVRDADFTTLSGVEVDPVYGPADESAVPGFERIGYPGEFPFTRGLHATGYRGRAWTIRQFAGFGNAKQTNERYRMILAEGGGGLSVAFDMPTLMGLDSDDPRVPRRGRPLRRRDRHRRRHGRALRRHPARRHHDVDDDQRPRRPRVLHVPGRRRAPGRRPRRRSTARCRPTSSRSTSRRRSGSSRPSRTCA